MEKMVTRIEPTKTAVTITVEAPAVTCGLCGFVQHQEFSKTQDLKNALLHTPPVAFFRIPEWDEWRWISSTNSPRILLCPTCSEPVRKQENENAKTLAVLYKEIIEKLNLRDKTPG